MGRNDAPDNSIDTTLVKRSCENVSFSSQASGSRTASGTDLKAATNSVLHWALQGALPRFCRERMKNKS